MNISDMSAVRHAQAAGDCDNRNHPNHPDNLTGALAADLIAAEADALMAECTDLAAAQDFADNWEALMEDRETIICMASRLVEKYPQDVAEAALGGYVYRCIRAAAMKRAAHQLGESSC